MLAITLISFALSIGLLTPVAAMTGLLLHGMIWVHTDTVRVIAAVIVTLDVLALAMLGPGAYSIDAWRFGRRIVVIPPA